MTTCCTTFNKYKRYGAYHWGWYAHKAKYTRYVDHVKEWVKEKNTLDVGAGDGLIVSVLGIKGIDININAIRAAYKKGVEITYGDTHNLPFKDEEFDSVFMGSVLEHLTSPTKAIRECRRILKSYLYLIVPTAEDPFFINIDELQEMVNREGFILEGEILNEEGNLWGKFKKI